MARCKGREQRGRRAFGSEHTNSSYPPIAAIQIDKDEPASAGSKYLQMFALSLVYEAGEL